MSNATMRAIGIFRSKTNHHIPDVEQKTIENTCRLAIQNLCHHLPPPIHVEDFIAHQTVVKLLGDKHHIELSKEDAQTILTAKWLNHYVTKSKNLTLMTAIIRLAGTGNNTQQQQQYKQEEEKVQAAARQQEITELETTKSLLHITEKECDEMKEEIATSTNYVKILTSKNEMYQQQLATHQDQQDALDAAETRNNELALENQRLKTNLEQVLKDFGLRDLSESAFKQIHEETDRLHHRLSKQKKLVTSPFNTLKKDNTRLVENFNLERRSSVVAHSQIAELELILNERDVTIDGLNMELNGVKGERDKCLVFITEALGRNELADALDKNKVRLSMARSKIKY